MAENMVDQLDQDLTRFKKPAMAAVGGIAAALVIATLPPVYLEKIIGMTGISEIIAAAAPPLGNTARGLIAVAAGLVMASATYFFINRKGAAGMGMALPKFNSSDDRVEDAGKPKFALPKFSLKKLLQKPPKKKGQVKDLADLPNLREADTHPDAPARKPIFADKDLGSPLTDKIKPFEEQPDPVTPDAHRAVAPAPFVMDKSLQMPEPQEPPLDLSGQVSAPSNDEMPAEATAEIAEPAAEAVMAPKEDMSGLSIAQLADRLETGLNRLKELESIANTIAAAPAPDQVTPVSAEQPAGGINVTKSEPLAPPPLKTVEPSPAEVEANRQADMDAALKAALGTLEKMTAQR